MINNKGIITEKDIEMIIANAKNENELIDENRILQFGEIQMSKDRYEFGLPSLKIGDGMTVYSLLDYLPITIIK